MKKVIPRRGFPGSYLIYSTLSEAFYPHRHTVHPCNSIHNISNAFAPTRTEVNFSLARSSVCQFAAASCSDS